MFRERGRGGGGQRTTEAGANGKPAVKQDYCFSHTSSICADNVVLISAMDAGLFNDARGERGGAVWGEGVRCWLLHPGRAGRANGFRINLSGQLVREKENHGVFKLL